MSLMYSKRGAPYFFVLTTVSSLGIHTNTAVQYDTNLRHKRLVGPTRDNIHPTVGSITWNPHYVQSEENHYIII